MFCITHTTCVSIRLRDTLVYGAIDDNANSAADVEEFYVEDAIEQLSAGQAITRSSTKSIGCTIKRLSN